jgi:hypothetical protein
VVTLPVAGVAPPRSAWSATSTCAGPGKDAPGLLRGQLLLCPRPTSLPRAAGSAGRAPRHNHHLCARHRRGWLATHDRATRIPSTRLVARVINAYWQRPRNPGSIECELCDRRNHYGPIVASGRELDR